MEKRLQTILAHAGVASRRNAASLIEEGKVKIDGEVVREKGFKLDPDQHEIKVNNKIVFREQKYYFLLNKPRNVISTAIDTHGRRKVTDFFDHIDARLYPIGRLDKDTTGVILVTNDGDLTHKLSHPSFEVDKEYVAVIRPNVGKKEIKKLSKGIEIDGKKTSPCEIQLLSMDREKGEYKIKLHEGRKRQIRRMFEEVGTKIISLKRTEYAGLKAGKVKEGDYRSLTGKEIKKLKRLIS